MESIEELATYPRLHAMLTHGEATVSDLGEARVKREGSLELGWVESAGYRLESAVAPDHRFEAVVHAPNGRLYAVEMPDAAVWEQSEARYEREVVQLARDQAEETPDVLGVAVKPTNVTGDGDGGVKQIFGDESRTNWDWALSLSPIDSIAAVHSRPVPSTSTQIRNACTATYVGDNFLVTAAHCIETNGEFAPIGRTVCLEGGMSCTQVLWQAVPAAWMSSPSIGNDYGLLRTLEPLGAGTKMILSVGSGSTLLTQRHFNLGYPGARPDGSRNVQNIMVEGRRRIIRELWGMAREPFKVSSRVLKTRMDVSSGHSGGPIFYVNGIYGFQTGIMTTLRDFSGTSRDYNGGPLIAPIRGWFTTWMFGG